MKNKKYEERERVSEGKRKKKEEEEKDNKSVINLSAVYKTLNEASSQLVVL